LQDSKRLTTSLIFKGLVRKFQRMLNTIGIHFRAKLLHDYAREIILKILGDPGDHRSTNGKANEGKNSFREFRSGEPILLFNKVVNNFSGDMGVEKREDLANRGQE
jgi:hypothetical protein